MKGQSSRQAVVLPKRSAVATAVSTVIMASAMSSPAWSQEIEEVIVTATKRAESVQDVPLAITALSGNFIEAVNLNDVKDLIAFTPGITGNSQDSFIDAVSVRGVRTQDFGVGGDPSAAIFKNDLYEGRNGSAVTSLYDIDRAEVLRGPQGFLFGRNSIGGAISVHTRQADIEGGNTGYADLDVAENGHFVFEGAANIPVSDTFAMRVAGYHSQEDGFVHNFGTNSDLIEHDKSAIRWSTAYESERLSLETQAEYETRKQSGSVYRAVMEGDYWDTLYSLYGDAIVLRGDERDADSDQSYGDNDDSHILTLGVRVDYDFDSLTFTSITGYKDHDFFYTEDYDGTPLNINNYHQDQEGQYFQQEFRVVSNDDRPLSWYAGASFYKEDIDTLFVNSGAEDNFCNYYGNYYYPGNGISDCQSYWAYIYPGSTWTPSSDGNLTEPGRVIGDYKGWAGYVDLTYAFSDSFDVSLGIRYTNDQKDFSLNVPEPESLLGGYWAYIFTTDGAIRTSDSWSDTSTRLVGRWHVSDAGMVYASYTEGYKSGGFGSFSLVDANGDRVTGVYGASQADGYRSRAFEPEHVDSYEVGYKGRVFNDTTDVAITGFLYNYENLQISFYDTEAGANTVENVGQVDGKGIEASITSEFNDNWNLYLGLSWLNTDATGVQQVCDGDTPDSCEGSSLFWAPDFAGAAVLNGSFPMSQGSLHTSLEASWEGKRGGGWGGYPETMIDSYLELALRVDYESNGSWSAGAYIENLTDEFTYDGENNNGGILPSHFFGHKRPRTAGIRFRYNWE
jgi:iron complex outermembrane recepter protein